VKSNEACVLVDEIVSMQLLLLEVYSWYVTCCNRTPLCDVVGTSSCTSCEEPEEWNFDQLARNGIDFAGPTSNSWYLSCQSSHILKYSIPARSTCWFQPSASSWCLPCAGNKSQMESNIATVELDLVCNPAHLGFSCNWWSFKTSDSGRMKAVPIPEVGMLTYVGILDKGPKVCMVKKRFSHVDMLCGRHQQMQFCLTTLV
jgi:hypothetical protein